jgi:hypothetical protein
VTRVHHKAVELALGLPNPAGLTPDALQRAAAEDGPVDDILSVVRLFQWLLPGLVLNVAFLRGQLAEVSSDVDSCFRRMTAGLGRQQHPEDKHKQPPRA